MTLSPSATFSVTVPPPAIDSMPSPRFRGRPDKIRVEYEITRDSASEQTLWATVVDLGIRKPFARSRAPYVCGVIAQPDLKEPNYRALTSARIVCGGGDNLKSVSINDEDVLRLGAHRIQFYRFTEVDHSDIHQPLPPARDCAGKPSVQVNVKIQRKQGGLWLVIPDLGIEHSVVEERNFNGRWYCLSTLRSRAQRMHVGCDTPTYDLDAWLTLERDVLFLDIKVGTPIGDVYQFSRVGFELPCNAVPQFHGYDYLSPQYLDYPNNCSDRCMMRSARCERDCDEKFSDVRGELDEKGRECSDQCHVRREACGDRCVLE